jgi:hypothetical protein
LLNIFRDGGASVLSELSSSSGESERKYEPGQAARLHFLREFCQWVIPSLGGLHTQM